MAFVLAVILLACCVQPVLAEEIPHEIQIVVYPQVCYLPNDGADHFTTEYKDTTSNTRTTDTLGSGASVDVPIGEHYSIVYRLAYYKYKVVETEYKEGYVPGYGWHRLVVGTKTCYVNVFSHWDFSVVR